MSNAARTRSEETGTTSVLQRRHLSDASAGAPAPQSGRRSYRSGRSTRAIALLLSASLLLAFGVVLLDQQRHARDDLVARFELRAELGSRFLESYVGGLLARERQLAPSIIGTRKVGQRQFEALVLTLGFRSAVLFDERGRVIRATPGDEPPDADLFLAEEDLRRALAGEPVVTGVVTSATGTSPVVAIAVAFPAATARRVLTGTLAVSQSSLGRAYLRNISPLADASIWLIDAHGATIASSSSTPAVAGLLGEEDPALREALGSVDRGRYVGPHGTARFVAVGVEGTPWRLVVAAPESQILQPIGGARTFVPWLVFAGLAVALGMVLFLQLRLAKARSRELHEVGLLSLTDPLTGLYNRRGYELLAGQLLKDATRGDDRVLLLFFDMDGLKKINDELGHDAGNEALIAAAEVLRSTFRDSDVVARVGGDEFCVVGMLPGTPSDGTAQLARLDDALDLYNRHEGANFRLSLSGGLTIYEPKSPKTLQELEAEADARMYADKRSRVYDRRT